MTKSQFYTALLNVFVKTKPTNGTRNFIVRKRCNPINTTILNKAMSLGLIKQVGVYNNLETSFIFTQLGVRVCNKLIRKVGK